ncbi:hypothetical protein [Antribacter gilvus]|uniref:hypothetical protein n=1 Tax=Antribacter gilvus TaxID=2304675 RepID=UPI000F784D70|nr:hypothetical protein [Antribacter gilvus]
MTPGPSDPLGLTLGQDLRPRGLLHRKGRPEHQATQASSGGVSHVPAWGTPSPTGNVVHDAVPGGESTTPGALVARARRPLRFWRWFGIGAAIALLVAIVRLPAGDVGVKDATTTVALIAVLAGGVALFVVLVLGLVWLVGRAGSTPAGPEMPRPSGVTRPSEAWPSTLGGAVGARGVTNVPFAPWVRGLALCLGAFVASLLIFISISD